MEKNTGYYIFGRLVEAKDLDKTIKKAIVRKTIKPFAISYLLLAASICYIHELNNRCEEFDKRLREIEKETEDMENHEGD